MSQEGSVVVFLAEFDHQVELVEKIYATLDKKLERWPEEPVSAEGVESAGYWLHNLYCALEDLFKLVSAFFENHLADDGSYHVSLLKRMILKIDKVRPPLLSTKSYEFLNELRGFRHVFRHAYTFGLDDERVVFLLRRVVARKGRLLEDLKTFRAAVATVGEGKAP